CKPYAGAVGDELRALWALGARALWTRPAKPQAAPVTMGLMAPLLVSTDDGLYCPAGDFHIDPWRPVDRAILTHAHADHACRGCRQYLAAATGEPVFRARLGPDADITPLPYAQPLDHNSVRVSLHPAGHILGSAQVRLEHRGEVWVVSGDYKLAP